MLFAGLTDQHYVVYHIMSVDLKRGGSNSICVILEAKCTNQKLFPGQLYGLTT